jgi:hypothetical protein
MARRMKIHAHIEQGSADWFKLRLGIPTASCFDLIVTPKKCDLSKSAYKYALKLCAERLLNMPTDTVEGVEWMERGREMEPLAVRQYEFQLDAQTVPVGFITTDDGSMGCSPDRLVLDDRKIGLEIKCPSPHVHLSYLLNGMADEYKPQVQGQILIAEFDRADFYSFHPRMPPALIHTTRDEEYLAKLSAALRAFKDQLHEITERALKLGVYQAARDPLAPHEAQALNDVHRDETFERFQRHGFAN